MGKGKKKSKVRQKQKKFQKSKSKTKSRQYSQKKASLPAKTPTKSTAYLVAIAQINTLVGDISGNTKKIIAYMEQAKERGAQLVVFPELSITGYPPKDLLFRQDFVDTNMQKFIEIVSACKGIIAVFGFVNKENGVLYNAVACVRDQKIIGIQNKSHLPVSDIYDEKRYFTEGSNADIIYAGNLRIGIIIAKHTEEETAIQQLVAKGIDLLVCISAVPYSIEKNQEQYAMLIAKKYQVPYVYCNCVGAQENLVFEGASFVVDKNGLVSARLKKFGEELFLADINKAGSSFIPSKDQTSEVYQAITLGIRDYFAKTGHAKAVIGISGGLDSSVTATLAVHALGKENVIGIILSSKITPKESLQDAKKICGNLGIVWKQVNIDPIVLLYARAAGCSYDKKNISFTEQNIQTRTRAALLMNYANKNNALVLSAINKTDLATGYFTIYGEATGALAPIADLWKTQVYLLAGFINVLQKQKSKANFIPESIIKKQPSQELRLGQKDSDDLPSYDVLDKILQLYVVHKKDIHEIAKMKFDAELVRKIVFMVVKSEFKRQQMPMPLRISSYSFGRSWQYPVVSGWRG